jgi:hypothetical protein
MCIHCTWSDLNGTTQEYNTKDKTWHMILDNTWHIILDKTWHIILDKTWHILLDKTWHILLDKTWCDSMNKTCMYIVPVYDTTHEWRSTHVANINFCKSLVWPEGGLNAHSTALEVSIANHYTIDVVNVLNCKKLR